MKLSELRTDRACDVLCQIAPRVAAIAGDTDLMDQVGRVVDIDLKSITRYGLDLILVERAAQVLPVLLKDHRADVYTILGAVNDMEPKKVAEQDFMTTKNQITELLEDDSFTVFFRSFGRRASGG